MARSRRHPRLIFGLALLVIPLAFLFPALDRWAERSYRNSIEDTYAEFETLLDKERVSLLQRNREMLLHPELEKIIAERDTAQAKTFMGGPGVGKGARMIVGGDGAVVARSDSDATGDHIFETTVWGQAVAGGARLATFGEGRDFPLVMVAGEPAGENGSRGAVFSTIPLDNEYASWLKGLNIKDGTNTNRFNIVFYSSKDGVTGMSFADEGTRSVLTAAFNSGSDWIRLGETDREMLIEGRFYLVRNIPLGGTDGETPGGMLVFREVRHAYVSLILAGALALFFLCVLYAAFRLGGKSSHWSRHRLAIFGGAAGIFAVAFVINQAVLKSRAVPLVPVPYQIYNSTLELVPGADIFNIGESQRIKIKLVTGGEAVNAAGILLGYDPAMVEILSIDTGESFCDPDLFIERAIDAQKGEVRVTCGLPTPGFSGKIGTVASVTVKPLKEGKFALRFKDGTAVLANDGLGTDVLRATSNGSYRVSAGAGAEVPVHSSTHPNDELAYKERSIRFSWPGAAGEFVYAFDEDPDGAPRRERTTTGTNLTLAAPADGTFYLHLAPVREGEPGPVSHFKVTIDSTPPEPPVIRASQTEIKTGEMVRFEFIGGTDARPGFYVKVNEGIFLPTREELYIPFLEAGRHRVKVRTFDRAGNWSENEIVINVRGPSVWERIMLMDAPFLFR